MLPTRRKVSWHKSPQTGRYPVNLPLSSPGKPNSTPCTGAHVHDPDEPGLIVYSVVGARVAVGSWMRTRMERLVQRNILKYHIRLREKQLAVLSTALLEADRDSDLPGIDRDVETLRDVLVQRRALRVELTQVDGDLEEIENVIKVIQATMTRNALVDDTSSMESWPCSSDSGSILSPPATDVTCPSGRKNYPRNSSANDVTSILILDYHRFPDE